MLTKFVFRSNMLFFGTYMFLVFMLTVKSGSSLSCYHCDEHEVTATSITVPSGCSKKDVNDMYCTIDIDFGADAKGHMSIQSETSHRAYGYNEDFVLLGLTIQRDGSYGYGFTYHCLTNGCNEPKLAKLQLLLNSTTIEHNIDAILPLLYTSAPDSPVNCSRYTNFTDSTKCYSSEQSNISCSTCFATMDGITNSMCIDCLEKHELIVDLLVDERAYLLKSRKTSNHNFTVHCNIQECNQLEKIERIRKLYRYDFDTDRFITQSISTSLFSNHKMICFTAIILLILNTV